MQRICFKDSEKVWSCIEFADYNGFRKIRICACKLVIFVFNHSQCSSGCKVFVRMQAICWAECMLWVHSGIAIKEYNWAKLSRTLILTAAFHIQFSASFYKLQILQPYTNTYRRPVRIANEDRQHNYHMRDRLFVPQIMAAFVTPGTPSTG